MNSKYKIRTIICKFCKKSITKRMNNNRHFCTQKCYISYIKLFPIHISKKYKKICFRCKKIFYVVPSHSLQKFCSHHCYHPKCHLIKIKCKTCSKIFKISSTPWNLSHLPTYCSSKCCNRAKHIVYHHIDLNKKNNKKYNKLILTNILHGKIHHHAYTFLVETNLINRYIKWFKNKFKKEIKKERLK